MLKLLAQILMISFCTTCLADDFKSNQLIKDKQLKKFNLPSNYNSSLIANAKGDYLINEEHWDQMGPYYIPKALFTKDNGGDVTALEDLGLDAESEVIKISNNQDLLVYSHNSDSFFIYRKNLDLIKINNPIPNSDCTWENNHFILCDDVANNKTSLFAINMNDAGEVFIFELSHIEQKIYYSKIDRQNQTNLSTIIIPDNYISELSADIIDRINFSQSGKVAFNTIGCDVNDPDTIYYNNCRHPQNKLFILADNQFQKYSIPTDRKNKFSTFHSFNDNFDFIFSYADQEVAEMHTKITVNKLKNNKLHEKKKLDVKIRVLNSDNYNITNVAFINSHGDIIYNDQHLGIVFVPRHKTSILRALCSQPNSHRSRITELANEPFFKNQSFNAIFTSDHRTDVEYTSSEGASLLKRVHKTKSLRENNYCLVSTFTLDQECSKYFSLDHEYYKQVYTPIQELPSQNIDCNIKVSVNNKGKTQHDINAAVRFFESTDSDGIEYSENLTQLHKINKQGTTSLSLRINKLNNNSFFVISSPFADKYFHANSAYFTLK